MSYPPMSFFGNRKIFFLVLLGAVVAGAVFYVVKEKFVPPPLTVEETVALYEEAHSAHAEARLDESIVQFSDLVERGTDMASVRRGETHLAYDLAARGRPEDLARSAEIYKRVILNTSYAPEWRGSVVSALASLYNLTQDDAIARDYVFAGEPFGHFYAEGDLFLAKRRLYEYGLQLYPLAVLDFHLAGLYPRKIIEEADTLKEDERASYTASLSEWAKIGDADLERNLQDIRYNTNTVRALRLLQAKTHDWVAEFVTHDYTRAEASYERVLAMMDGTGGIHALEIEREARIFYAAMLAHTYGARRTDDIARILEPTKIAVPEQWRPSIFFDTAIRNIGSNPQHYYREWLVSLATFYPPFAPFLRERGWAI